MFKRAGSLARLKEDGSIVQVSDVMKGIRDGWTYFVHFEDGRCRMIKRTDFEYLTKKKTGRCHKV